MENNFKRNKIRDLATFWIAGSISHAAIPISIDYIFHKFKFTIFFTILIILSVLIYSLTKNHISKVKIKIWEKVAKYSLYAVITTTILLLFFSLFFVSTTKNGVTYIQGTDYTRLAENAKLIDLISDDDLIDGFSGKVEMVYTNYKFFERIFSIFLFIFVISFDLWQCCNLKIKSLRRKSFL